MEKVQALTNRFSLNNGEVNHDYRVVDINGEFKIKRRLLDFGFVDTNIRILHKSSLNGVFLLQIRGFVLSLRASLVANIIVEEA